MVVILLKRIKLDLPAWREAILSKYRNLVNKIIAVKPVDFKKLDKDWVKFVPGKLVGIIKAGPNGGYR